MTKPRVLVIDDEPALARVLEGVFRYAGFDTVLAGDGNRGLAAFEAARFDVVVSDIIMPEREGFDTIRQIRQRSQDVVIVALSGCGRLDPGIFRALAHEVGADAFLQKPFLNDELIALVNDKLAARDAVTLV
ncbi:Transcriptional regulatory protein WalR [Alphaproteobacteria bacterium SO-S41]|nr:Transcriptional regulatory protein WalR [Alphaproteobacteria bacterium SO-S41]